MLLPPYPATESPHRIEALVTLLGESLAAAILGSHVGFRQLPSAAARAGEEWVTARAATGFTHRPSRLRGWVTQANELFCSI
jgi:hypothetical protein